MFENSGRSLKFVCLASCMVFIAACESRVASNVVCWEEPVRPVTPGSVVHDKFAPKHAAETHVICAPINMRPADKPIVYSGSQDSAPSGPAPSPSPTPDPEPTQPDAPTPPESTDGAARPTDQGVEFSETNDRGSVAAIKNADNTVEYSVVDRDSNIVRAVDDRTVTNANDAKKLRDQIFNEVGLQAEN